MFRAKRRSDSDLGCKWDPDDSLDREFTKLFDDCDFYAVRHWFLKCATAPAMEYFYDKADVEKYLREAVAGGDALEIWSVVENKSIYITAKMPDENGLIPVKNCAY